MLSSRSLRAHRYAYTSPTRCGLRVDRRKERFVAEERLPSSLLSLLPYRIYFLFVFRFDFEVVTVVPLTFRIYRRTFPLFSFLLSPVTNAAKTPCPLVLLLVALLTPFDRGVVK